MTNILFAQGHSARISDIRKGISNNENVQEFSFLAIEEDEDETQSEGQKRSIALQHAFFNSTLLAMESVKESTGTFFGVLRKRSFLILLRLRI